MASHLPRALVASVALLVSLAASAAGGPVAKDREVSVHAPYAMGQCAKCHVRDNPTDPGPAPPYDEGCLECHDEFKGPVQLDAGPHPTGKRCVECHNAHSSVKKHLLM